MTLTIGLRFDRRDAPLLRALVARGESEGIMHEHLALFRRAAEDAARGEPLRLICDSVMEAQAMAHGFTIYGVRRPAVEALS